MEFGSLVSQSNPPGGGHPFENNFTCAIERGRVARSSYVEWRIALGFCAPVPPNAIPVVLLLPDRAGRKWIWSSSSCSSGKCRRREREISIWTKALLCAHCGFATERKSGEGRGLPGSRYSLDGGILSSFESELCFFHFKSAVAVPDPCKKSRFEIYAGDYRSVDPRLWKKAISPLTGTTGSRVPRSPTRRARGSNTLKTRIKR